VPPGRVTTEPTQIETIGLEDALLLAHIALDMASEDGGKPVSITVADALGEQLVVMRMDGASLDSRDISIAKARAAARGKKDTAEILFQRTEERQEWHPRSAEEVTEAENAAASRRAAGHTTYVTWAGGACVLRYGKVLGAVGISGRDQLDDHELAHKTANRWLFGYMAYGDRVVVKSSHGAGSVGRNIGEHIGQYGSVINVNRDDEPNELCIVQIDDGPQITACGHDLEHS